MGLVREDSRLAEYLGTEELENITVKPKSDVGSFEDLFTLELTPSNGKRRRLTEPLELEVKEELGVDQVKDILFPSSYKVMNASHTTVCVFVPRLRSVIADLSVSCF